MRRLLHSTVKIRVETLLASWIFGRGPRYHQRAHQPVPARLQSDCGGSPSPVIGLAAIAADARVIPTGRNSDPCVMAGLGPATHDFCSCHQQSRGWPAGACPRAGLRTDPWAGHDTSESASTRDGIIPSAALPDSRADALSWSWPGFSELPAAPSRLPACGPFGLVIAQRHRRPRPVRRRL